MSEFGEFIKGLLGTGKKPKVEAPPPPILSPEAQAQQAAGIAAAQRRLEQIGSELKPKVEQHAVAQAGGAAGVKAAVRGAVKGYKETTYDEVREQARTAAEKGQVVDERGRPLSPEEL